MTTIELEQGFDYLSTPDPTVLQCLLVVRYQHTFETVLLFSSLNPCFWLYQLFELLNCNRVALNLNFTLPVVWICHSDVQVASLVSFLLLNLWSWCLFDLLSSCCRLDLGSIDYWLLCDRILYELSCNLGLRLRYLRFRWLWLCYLRFGWLWLSWLSLRFWLLHRLWLRLSRSLTPGHDHESTPVSDSTFLQCGWIIGEWSTSQHQVDRIHSNILILCIPLFKLTYGHVQVVHLCTESCTVLEVKPNRVFLHPLLFIYLYWIGVLGF